MCCSYKPVKYYSYRIDVRPYVSPTVGACSISVNPVVPLYNASDMGIPYPTASIQQPLWDNMQQQEVPIGFQGDDSSIGIVACSGSNVAGSIPRDVYPLGQEHASRTLLLSSMPTELSKEDLRQELEVHGIWIGDEKGLSRFFIIISCMLKQGLTEIQEQHLLQQQRLQQQYNSLFHRKKEKGR
jgi:hypothetical protein